MYDLKPFGGRLYAGTLRNPDGAEVWRTDGVAWTRVVTGGFGDANNLVVSALAAFGGQLYAAAGLHFSPVFTGGLGNAANCGAYGLVVFENQLYAVFSNVAAGVEVWRTGDGTIWSRIGLGGWGDGNNRFADYFDKGAAIFEDRLYIGTLNNVAGGQIWLLLSRPAYLPILRRQNA